MSRRRNTGGTPRALDDVRVRRGAAQSADGQAVGKGLGVDRAGRIEQTPGEEFYFDGQGRQKLRADGVTLEVSGGSPAALRVKLGDDSIKKTSKGVVARPSTDNIKATGMPDKNLTATLNRFEQAFQAADAAILASILPFKCGTETLSLGSTQFVPGYDLSSGTYAVFVGRQVAGTSPGHLYSDSGTWTSTKVQVDSTDPSDDAGIWWMVVKLT